MKVFLSYPPNYKSLADEIATYLSDIVDVRRDDGDTGTMANFSEQIAACDTLIVLVNCEANTSQRVITHVILPWRQKFPEFFQNLANSWHFHT